MRIRSSLNVGLGIAALTLSLSACKKGTSGSDSSDDEGSTAVIMQGNLALVGVETTGATSGLLLAAQNYDLYCVTFAESPSACKIDVSVDESTGKGGFDKSCENFANVALGCFIRRDAKTLATIEFDGNNSLAIGAGSLFSDITFDLSTGLAFGKIDKEKSSALGGKVKGTPTDVGDLTGVWHAACEVDDKMGMTCPEGLENDGFDVYYSQYTHADKARIALWESKEKHDICIADGRDASPSFFMKLASTSATIDFSSRKEFEASMDGVYTSLTNSLKTKVDKAAKERSDGMYAHCSYKSPFSEENCRLVETTMNSNTWFDPATNKEVTKTFPKYYEYSEFNDKLKNYTGAVTTKESECSMGEFNPGMPHCPPNASDKGDGKGTFTAYLGANGNQLSLVCRVEWDSAHLNQMPASGANITEAVAAMGAKKPPECETSENPIYAGRYKGEVEELRGILVDLANTRMEEESGDGENMCAQFTIAKGFTWKSCNQSDPKQSPVCSSLEWHKLDLGMQVDTKGRLVYDPAAKKPSPMPGNGKQEQGPPVIWEGLAQIVCPVAYKAQGSDHKGGVPRQTCADEFALKDPEMQAKALLDDELKWRPLGEKIICLEKNPPTPAYNELTAMAESSCLPEVRYERMCDGGGECKTALRCSGSRAGGKCFDETGGFAGRINGRMMDSELKVRIGGAFEMAETTTDRWQNWDPESSKPRECTFTSSTVVNARMIDSGSFTGTFTEAGKEECSKDSSKPGQTSLTQGAGESPKGEKDDKGHNETFKINFTRK